MEYVEPEGPLMAKGMDNPEDEEPMTVEGCSGSCKEGVEQKGGWLSDGFRKTHA